MQYQDKHLLDVLKLWKMCTVTGELSQGYLETGTYVIENSQLWIRKQKLLQLW